jgi:hypothetical protein
MAVYMTGAALAVTTETWSALAEFFWGSSAPGCCWFPRSR